MGQPALRTITRVQLAFRPASKLLIFVIPSEALASEESVFPFSHCPFARAIHVGAAKGWKQKASNVTGLQPWLPRLGKVSFAEF